MSERTRVILVLLLGAVVLGSLLAFARPARDSAEPTGFAAEVDLNPLGTIAVHHDGRLRSFWSHASALMHQVTGPHRVNGQSPAFTYLDLMIRPAAYEDADVIYVKNKLVRADIRDALKASFAEYIAQLRPTLQPDMVPIFDETMREREARLDAFLDTGLISHDSLNDPRVDALLERLSRDVVRTAKDVDQINAALTVMNPDFLRRNLGIVPPPSGDEHQAWLTMDEVVQVGMAQEDLGLEPELQQQLVSGWRTLHDAWRDQDAASVNSAAIQFASLLPAVSPEIYPDQARLAWESWYFRARNMVWVWMIYVIAIVPLLISVVYRWPAARWTGLALFLLAFGFHTFALGLRWYVSGRWPNSNMFEAVTTAAWFGGCGAILLEIFARRTPMRNFFALGSAVASMCALLAARLFPLQLDPNISNMMPVLHDVWLYIHTNVIIFSYVLIFMAGVTAFIYLAYRLVGGQADFARVGGAGSLMLAGQHSPSAAVVVASGGSGGLPSESRRSLSTLGQVLDGTTMVLMELGFIMLWAGLVMGAIWADHSWGRPWGWDPKEVFALNTFIILALLIHVRMKVKDKGLWTAVLALIGCVVMLFNWIIINFTIAGLHSYA